MERKTISIQKRSIERWKTNFVIWFPWHIRTCLRIHFISCSMAWIILMISKCCANNRNGKRGNKKASHFDLKLFYSTHRIKRKKTKRRRRRWKWWEPCVEREKEKSFRFIYSTQIDGNRFGTSKCIWFYLYSE